MSTKPLFLIVEQDRQLSAELARALYAQQCAVLGAASASEALQLLSKQTFDGLIIDAQLGETNGFDLARTVRRESAQNNLAILLITEVRWPAKQKAAMIEQLRLVDLLAKPVDAQAAALALVNKLPSWKTPDAQDQAPTTVTVSSTAPTPQQTRRMATPVFRREPTWSDLPPAAETMAALRGDLAAVPFPWLLHMMQRQAATGALFLRNDAQKRIIFFREGRPIHVKTNQREEAIGNLLLQEGLITRGENEASLSTIENSGQTQAETLLKMRAIKPQQLAYALARQLQSRLVDIFAWTNGDFFFQTDAVMPPPLVPLELSSAEIIAAGIRATWDTARLQMALSPYLDRQLMVHPDPALRFQEIQLHDEEQYFLDSIDGSRTLREYLADTALNTPKALALAYILLITEIIVVTIPAAATTANPGYVSSSTGQGSGGELNYC